MSEYTREEILKMIEENGGPENLDLSGKGLSGIDLSKEAIAEELEEYRKNHYGETPLWFSDETEGINLKGAILKKANLTRAHLEGAFLWRTYLEEAYLWGAHLEGIILRDAHLQEAILIEANLQEARLDMANLQMTSLSRANLQKATLHGANLQQAVLSYANLQEASLDGANLQRTSLFSTNLQKATFHGANLQQANLFEAHLEKVDLSVVASLAGACFHEAWLDQTRMTKEQLGGRIGEEIKRDYYAAKEAYLLLKNNFNQIGRYDDASWAYIKERQMEKRTYHPEVARRYYAKIEDLPEGASPKSWTWWRFYVKYTLKWGWDWIIEWLCGYGEKPGRVLRAMLLLLVIAPFGYRLFGGLTHADGRVAGPLDYLVYSFDAFTRIVGTDLAPLCMWGHLVTGLEAFFALLLASLFIYTLGRRISRS